MRIVISLAFILSVSTSFANPLINYQTFPDFAAIKPEDIQPAVEQVTQDFFKVMDEKLLLEPSWDNLVQPLEEQLVKVEKVSSLLVHIDSVNNTPEFHTAYEAVQPILAKFDSDVSQNKSLYEAYLKIQADLNFLQLPKYQQTRINKAIRDFKLGGVGLEPEQRDRYLEIAKRLQELSLKFSNNVQQSRDNWNLLITDESRLAGLPEFTIKELSDNAKQAGKTGWLVTLSMPVRLSIFSDAKDRELRKTVYLAQNHIASDLNDNGQYNNAPIIAEILQLRQEISELVGYRDFAEYSLVTKMADSPFQILDFMKDLAAKAQTQAEQELQVLKDFAKEKDGITDFQPWDLSYYAELYKDSKYSISQNMLREYFPEHQVKKGLFSLVNLLYGIQIKEVKPQYVWNEQVKLYEILGPKGKLRGYLYMDLYARPGKRDGAWVMSLQERMKSANNEISLPVITLQTNFNKPESTFIGSYLTHEQVRTLFHEFGHAMHGVLSKVDLPSVGSSALEWDVIELPSQFMENWIWEWQVIQDITQHKGTGGDLPKAIFENLIASKNFNAGLALLRQIEFGIFDMRIHMRDLPENQISYLKIFSEVKNLQPFIPRITDDRFPNSFAHVFAGGYSAGYYGYLWSEVLSADTYSAFQDEGLFNPLVGKRFLTSILERGAVEDPDLMFQEFRGREPSIEPLLRSRGIIIPVVE